MWATFGRCEGEDEHCIAKDLFCGREWCPTCGGKDGPSHNRRKSLWYPRVRRMAEMGYLVLTVPPELRGKYRTRLALSKLGIAVKRMMQRQGFKRGLRRWHFFGDVVKSGETPVYHPHLNVLVEAGYLQPERLRAIKSSWAAVLGIDEKRINLRYSYTDVPAKMWHMVSYVLRPTFGHWEWAADVAEQVIGLRNTLAWGTWGGEDLWELPGEERPMKRGCPVCGSPVKWRGVTGAGAFEDRDWKDLGDGNHLWVGEGAPYLRVPGEGDVSMRWRHGKLMADFLGVRVERRRTWVESGSVRRRARKDGAA